MILLSIAVAVTTATVAINISVVLEESINYEEQITEELVFEAIESS